MASGGREPPVVLQRQLTGGSRPPLARDLPPPRPDLLRRRGAGHTDLPDRDRRDEVPERRGLLVRQPAHHRRRDPRRATVPRPDDVDGTGDGIGGDVAPAILAW